jgi:hypothetical protein
MLGLHNRGTKRHSISTVSTLLTEYLSGTHEDGTLTVQGGCPFIKGSTRFEETAVRSSVGFTSTRDPMGSNSMATSTARHPVLMYNVGIVP